MKKAKSLIDKMPKHRIVLNPKSYRMAHPVYSQKEVEQIKYTHKQPEGIRDRFTRLMIRVTRASFDIVSGYDPKTLDERGWMNRVIFLETVAGVPGMIGGMQRHLRSLRTLERDHGWIHHLLQEAENERMHLFFFLRLRNPGIIYRLLIAAAQGIFFNGYFLAYMLSPSTCHRFVGYLEEEAVHTYTVLLEQIDNGNLKHWHDMPAPPEAVEYYQLPADATFRDMVSHVRADEACHRDLNHHFADIKHYNEVDSHEVSIVNTEAEQKQEGETVDPKGQKLVFGLGSGEDVKNEQRHDKSDVRDSKI